MARISTYGVSSPAVVTDELIGSDIAKATKNFTIGSIIDITGIPAGTDNTLSMFGPGPTLIDSIVTQTTEGSINVGIVPSKGGGTPSNPYWIDKFQVQGTMSVSGNVAIGTPRELENQGFDLNILGNEGKIAFGDNNVFGDPALGTPITWNVVVGEYGTGDSDVLQLHGKVGTRFTNGALGSTVSMSIDASGNVEIENNLTVDGDATFGEDDSTEVTIESTLSLQGPIKDSGSNLGGDQQILVSNASGEVSWDTGGRGTVTSIGITETGSALAITNTPITSSGDINIAGAGNNTQVILGDLTLGALPTGTVKGTGAVNFVPKWSATDTLQNSIIFDDGTNVGIGTAGINPADKLHVQGTVRSVVAAGSGFGFLTNRGTENSASGIRWDNNNSSLILKDSSEVTTTQLRSSGFSYINGGRLGINTPSPASTLDVKETTTDVAGQIIVGGLIDADDRAFGKLCFANTISANSQPNKILASIEGRKNGSSNRGILTFDVSDGSGALKERMRIDSYGFVGVGKNNPQRELDVVGTVRIAGALELLQSSNNTFVGTSTGNISTTTGSSNVAVGVDSLNNNTGGNGNVAVGKGALSANTGNNNTGTGSLALENISTGAQNTGIGRQALQNATTGLCNVGIGHIAGSLVDGGAANTAPDVSIFIGGSTKSKNNNDTNQIVIGHNAIGEGSNTARIGNTSVSQLHVGGNNAGVVLKSPNGTAYIIKVTNAGALTVTAV